MFRTYICTFYNNYILFTYDDYYLFLFRLCNTLNCIFIFNIQIIIIYYKTDSHANMRVYNMNQ